MQETPVQFLGMGRSGGEEKGLPTLVFLIFPSGSDGKESACNVGDLSLIPGLKRSSGERNGYPLQYSGLENSAKSGTGLSHFHFLHIALQVFAR